MSWPQLINMLSWWQWLILSMVPPAIVLLYFLKLKRNPLEVPSTYLWHKSIEDLHVNSIWQRLRRNLLLFLQLLFIFLAMLAVLRPGWRGSKLDGDRFIFLLDNSASMQATDVEKSRLTEAKRQVAELIERMGRDDSAMVVSFADAAQVEEMYTENKRRLVKSLDAIEPTPRRTSLTEAMKITSGLSDPGRMSFKDSDVQVAAPMPATLYIFSDGKFPSYSGFAPVNLKPIYQRMGDLSDSSNVGIVAFNVRRSETSSTMLQAFARLENFGSKEVRIELELKRDGEMIDASRLTLKKGETKGTVFELGDMDSGVLSLEADIDDHLAVDDVAWAVVNPPRPAQILFVTSGNEAFELALSTEPILEMAEITVVGPDFLNQKEYQQQAPTGFYDLVIYDRCSPKTMPQANTLFLGQVPPGKVWKVGQQVGVPQIIDVNNAHPIMQWIDLGNVLIAYGTPLEVPPAGTILIDSHAGSLFAIAPRESFEDAVMGFTLIEEKEEDGKVQKVIGTNWPIRPSFAVFALNFVSYFSNSGSKLGSGSIQPGDPIVLETPGPGKPLSVKTPDGRTIKLGEGRSGKVAFTGTNQLGVYGVLSEGKTIEHFAVNLFSSAESNIQPMPAIELGHKPLEGKTSDWIVTRRELWKWLLLIALGLLCIEWYIYNQRIYT